MKIDSSVNVVRNFRRQTFFQIERQEFHRLILGSAGRRRSDDLPAGPQALPPCQHALLEVQRPPRALGGVRIVRDHHDRLAVIAVERLQQVEDLVAGLAIEIAGRLVAQQQRRVGDDGARDADALLLTARQLARIVLRAIGEPDDLQRDRDALPPLGLRQLRQQQRQLDVPLGRQHRQQVVELKHEADVLRAPPRQLAAAERADLPRRRLRRLLRSAHRARPSG